MWDVVLGVLLILCIFTAIGLGPALWLFRRSIVLSLAVAPLLGVVFTTLIGTYLVSQDFPILSWANGWLFAGIGFSAFLSFFHFRRKPVALNPLDQVAALPFVLGLIASTCLILAPMIIGGLTFTVLRGNGTDTFNYLTMAGFLNHETLSSVYTASTESLINKHPSYSIAYQLFTKTRWSTSMLLGWCSSVSHLPLYRFEYGFTALFFILTYCAAYCFGLMMRIKPRFVLLIALAVSVGFYAQFVLDVRAMSQITTIPLLLLLAMLAVHPDNEKPKRWIGGGVIAGLTLAAIAMLYIELVPTILLGFFLFFVMQLALKQETLRSLVFKYSLPLLVAFIALLPVLPFLASLFMLQLHFAATVKNTWEMAYFHWIYKKVALGFWGFSILLNTEHSSSFKGFLDFLTTVLTVGFVYLVAASLFFKRHPVSAAMRLAIALLGAALCQMLYLYFHDQLWAAAKALTFGFPFIYFIVGGFFALSSASLNKTLLRLMQFSVLAWLFVQCGLGFYRIDSARNNYIYSNYISHHAYYRQHQWNINPIALALRSHAIHSVGLNVSDAWLTEYLAQVLGWDVHVVNLNGLPDRTGYVMPRAGLSAPEYSIILATDPGVAQDKVLARNSEFVLIQNKTR